MNWMDSGRFLVVAGTVIVIIGLVFMLADKIPLGRLPGDISVGAGRFRFYIPIATSILLSVALTIVLNFFARR
jgi:hypothetical protein